MDYLPHVTVVGWLMAQKLPCPNSADGLIGEKANEEKANHQKFLREFEQVH